MSHRPKPLFLLLLPALVVAVTAACGGGGEDGVPAPVFHVETSNPTDGQQNVPVDAAVFVTFNHSVDPTSAHLKSLRVGVVGGAGEIPGQAVLEDVGGCTIRWTPTTQMVPVSTHACEIDPGLRSEDGDRIGGDLTITFRTGGQIPGPDLPGRDDLETTTGKLKIGRRSHTATLLDSGRVLITGGFRQGTNITDGAELYFSRTFFLLDERMVEERAGHTATRLADGRVLLTGGWYEVSLGQLATTEGAEIYDPATEAFEAVGSMTTARVDHAALLLPDGRVLVTGGSRLDGSFLTDLDSAEVFDPVTGEFTLLAESMTVARATHVMEDMGNGKFLLYGGSDTDLHPEWFDTATEHFAALAPAAQDEARFGAAGATFESGAACVAGGDQLGTVVYVDPLFGYAQNTGSGLNAPRSYATATRYGPDRILVVGGFDFSRGYYMLPTCDVVIEGGLAGSGTYGCEMRFPTGMVFHTATRLGDGRVLFCGGLNENGGEPELDAAYLFTPP